MPILAAERATTVRQHSPWSFSKLTYGVIFLAVVAVALGWKYFGSRPPKVEIPQATAKVYIHHPNFVFEHAWQEALALARTDVRQNLHIVVQRSGQHTVAAISLSSVPPEAIVSMVNVVASAYAQACRAERKLQLEQAYSTAQEKVRQTERRAFEAETRSELLRDRRLQLLASLKPAAPLQPTTIENPRWAEIGHRLSDLEERRRVLLTQRTLQHPSVQEIDLRIGDTRREMASIPSKIVQEPPALPAPSAAPADMPSAAEVQAAQLAALQLKQEYQQAQSTEHAALAARGEELQIDISPAEPPLLPAVPRANTAIVGKALLAATTSLVGLSMISHGASLEPVLSNIAELQALLFAPVVGVIPAAHPVRRWPSSERYRKLARWSWMAAGLAVLLAVVWIIVRG